MSLFETGPVVTTPGIRDIMNLGPQAIDTVQKCLDRHCQGDWGDLCDDDKQLNQDSLDEEDEDSEFMDGPDAADLKEAEEELAELDD